MPKFMKDEKPKENDRHRCVQRLLIHSVASYFLNSFPKFPNLIMYSNLYILYSELWPLHLYWERKSFHCFQTHQIQLFAFVNNRMQLKGSVRRSIHLLPTDTINQRGAILLQDLAHVIARESDIQILMFLLVICDRMYAPYELCCNIGQ